MENKRHKNVPEIKGLLRSHVVEVPSCIRDCSGIKIFGKRIKSLLFTTDVAIIRNTNADAIIAVYPFTPQPLITSALVMAADVPVFCGVGGGITQGKRVVNLALDAEFKGAMGVVVNAPTSNEVVSRIRETIDIPLIVTVVSINEDIRKRIESGATILNVSGGKDTPNIVRKIKEEFAVVNRKYADVDENYKCVNRINQEVIINQYRLAENLEKKAVEMLKSIKNEINNLTKREIGYIIITGGITTMQGFNTIVEELFVRNATVMNLGIIGIRNNKYACSYGVIKYFVEKLDLREKKYTMYGDEKIEEIMSTRKKIGATGVLGKVFDKIFD